MIDGFLEILEGLLLLLRVEWLVEHKGLNGGGGLVEAVKVDAGRLSLWLEVVLVFVKMVKLLARDFVQNG